MRKNSRLFLVFCFALTLTGCDKFVSSFQDITSRKKETAVPLRIESPLEKMSPVEEKPSLPVSKPEAEKVTEPKPIKDLLAKVGSWQVSKTEFLAWLDIFKKMNPAAEIDVKDRKQQELLLQDLVNLQLLTQEAERQGLQNKSGLSLAVEVSRSNILVPELANTLIGGMELTDQEAKAFYDQNKDSFTAATEWNVREIVVATEEEAKTILVELYKGADFEEMVKQKSKSKSSWKKGDLGFRGTFDFPKMESVVKTLDVGDISGVFKGPGGYYIVKLEGRRGGAVQVFDDVKDDIKTGLLLMRQQQVMKDFIEKLKEKTAIVINEKLLQE